MGCRKLCKFYQWPGAGGQYCVCYRYNHYSNNPFGGRTQYDHNHEPASMILTTNPSGMELSRINLWYIIANFEPIETASNIAFSHLFVCQ